MLIKLSDTCYVDAAMIYRINVIDKSSIAVFFGRDPRNNERADIQCENGTAVQRAAQLMADINEALKPEPFEPLVLGRPFGVETVPLVNEQIQAPTHQDDPPAQAKEGTKEKPPKK